MDSSAYSVFIKEEPSTIIPYEEEDVKIKVEEEEVLMPNEDSRHISSDDHSQPIKRARHQLFDEMGLPENSSSDFYGSSFLPSCTTSSFSSIMAPSQASILSGVTHNGTTLANKIRESLKAEGVVHLDGLTPELLEDLFSGDPLSSGDEQDSEDDEMEEDPDLFLSSGEEDDEEEVRASVPRHHPPLQEPQTSPRVLPSVSTPILPSPLRDPSSQPSCTTSVPPSPSPIPIFPLDDFTWLDDRPHLQPLTFTRRRQVNITLANENWTPYNVFRLLFTDNFVQSIITESNVYGEHLKANVSSSRARMASWKNISKEEFMKFIGLLFHTGTIRLARLQEYWSKPETFRGLLHIPCFGKHMPRDRFFMILQALHFCRNPLPGQVPNDRLYKIRPVIDHFNSTMADIFTPGRNLLIDESMVLWRGRLWLRQYIQTKCHKYGMKLYVLAEPNGIALKFLLYAGSADVDIGGPEHSSLVVNTLLQGHTNHGHSVYADNFYNSLSLTRDMLQKKTYMTGTLKENRCHNPKDVTKSQLKRGEVVSRYTPDGICVMKWRDKRDVLMISSQHSADVTQTATWRGQTLQKPQIFVKYNESMSGIDRMDQMLAYYPCEQKSLKWYKKLAIHVFQMIMVNAWVIYCTCSPDGQKKRKSFHDFRLDVIQRLIFFDEEESQPSNSSYFHPTHKPSGPLLCDHHLVVTDSRGDTSGRKKKITCRVCKSKTHYYCSGCATDTYGNIGLCPTCLHLYNHK